ncbi:hypothetical protein D3C78_1930740 [compost metagenome]
MGITLNQAQHRVLDGHGQVVMTTASFAGYRVQLERYIAAHPKIQFWNSSRNGAAIAGCPYHPEFTA